MMRRSYQVSTCLIVLGLFALFVLNIVTKIREPFQAVSIKQEPDFPAILWNSVYRQEDFQNDIVPPFWDCKDGTCSTDKGKTWGPCYPPVDEVDWEREINNQVVRYDQVSNLQDNDSSLSNRCRPGFIIIGAGKCGTR